MPVIQQNISLKPYNTFAIDVSAKYFVEIFSVADLEVLFKQTIVKSEPLLFLGGGSNMLFTKDYDGLVIKLSIPGIDYQANDNDITLTAGAGVVWNDLVIYCIQKGFAGLENLTLIPGTVGASPIQNIGAYGVELKDVFESCNAFEIATGKIKTFNYAACKFGYRESVFKSELKGQYIITSVIFKLSQKASLQTHYGAITQELQQRAIAAPTIADISDVVASIRVSKLPDPKTIGNAGSFFKNPIIAKETFNHLVLQFPDMANYPVGAAQVKLAAGWLIEQCGFKGVISGHTGTWKNQALVLVNHGGATGKEVYDFSEKIINTVQQKFGVKLEREVNVF